MCFCFSPYFALLIDFLQVLFTMPMAPLVVNKTSGDWMWTAASVLSLRTPKLEFDPAMTLPDETTQQGLSMLERYVEMLLAQSFEDSALFWHYAMRHVPSDSLVCANATATQAFAKGSRMKFNLESGLAQKDPSLLLQAGSGIIPANGYGAFSLGGERCLCGWQFSDNACRIPVDLCTQLALQTCSYDPDDESAADSILEVSDFSNRTWECPDLDFSDSWGIVSTDSSDAWIKLSSSGSIDAVPKIMDESLSDVVRRGRAGLRIGNMKSMPQLAKISMDPLEREHSLKDVPLKRCASNILSTFDAQSFARSVSDDLFPAAQAVGTESLPVSACLRFSIEYSRMRVLKVLERTLVDRTAEMELQGSMQQAVVARWKHQCESQLGMLAVCKSNGIFDMVPPEENEHNCSFQILDAYDDGKYYVGPASCLVYISETKAFYDPCMHPTKECNSKGTVYSLSDLLGTPATRLQFDVRSLGNEEVLGTWPLKFYGSDEDKNEMAVAYAGMLEQFRTSGTSGVPWRLSTEFADQILGGTDTGSVGNTREKWASAEGFASKSTEFCDGISDWWPEVSVWHTHIWHEP